MKSRTVLMISQVFYPDEVSTANLFTNLGKYLVEKGIRLIVWSAHPSYTETRRQPRSVNYKGIEIEYLFSTSYRKSNLFGRLLNYLTFMISVSYRLIRSQEKCPVVSHTTPPSIGILISYLCKLRKRKFIYILLDIFPEGLVRLGKVSDRNPFVALWQRLFLSSLRKSERIIVVGRDMREWLTKTAPETSRSMMYIPLWQDEDLIQPVRIHENALMNELNLSDSFVVQYSGNMGLWNEMKTISLAVNQLYHEVFFLFIGGGRREKELFNNIEGSAKNSYIHLPFQSNSKLMVSLTACHCAIVSLASGLEGMAVPSKIYGIMAAGIAVIALVPELSEIARIVNEERCGIVVQPDDVSGLVAAIRFLQNNETDRLDMGRRGRNAFIKKYTTSLQSEKYIDLLKTL